METFETRRDELHPAPFTLFQAENGRWGTRDANFRFLSTFCL